MHAQRRLALPRCVDCERVETAAEEIQGLKRPRSPRFFNTIEFNESSAVHHLTSHVYSGAEPVWARRASINDPGP